VFPFLRCLSLNATRGGVLCNLFSCLHHTCVAAPSVEVANRGRQRGERGGETGRLHHLPLKHASGSLAGLSFWVCPIRGQMRLLAFRPLIGMEKWIRKAAVAPLLGLPLWVPSCAGPARRSRCVR
jgi:hypothetical protein